MSEDIDTSELEEQAWPEPADATGVIEHEFMDGTEMRFKVQDPDTEAIMSYIGPNIEGETQSQRQYEFVSSAVINPEIPIERWREWRPADQTAMSKKVAEHVGVDRIVDFRSEDLEELMSDSPSE